MSLSVKAIVVVFYFYKEKSLRSVKAIVGAFFKEKAAAAT